MNHLIDIIDALAALEKTGEDAVLATVIKIEGSAYRQPSARMLIQADGKVVGMVSGGCLEKQLVKKAFWLTRNGACVQRYHSAIAENEDFSTGETGQDKIDQEGFGLGCNGTIHVLFERVNSPQCLPLKTALQRLKQEKQPQLLHTIIASDHPDFPIGLHFFDKALLLQTASLSRSEPASRKTTATINNYQTDEFSFEVFSEILYPPLHLMVFGAGQDSLPLIEMAKIQGWVTTLIDSRADSIRLARYRPVQADTYRYLPLENAEQIQPLLTDYPHTSVVIMTHSVTQDRMWLQQTLTASPSPFYIGQLGPRYRTEKLLADIGMTDLPDHLFYPMGLPIGGDTPESVALATIAQIQSIFHHTKLTPNLP